MKRGFTLLEMLIVMGIIVVLAAVTLTSFSKLNNTGERAKAQELVSNVATALTALYETNNGIWPKAIREAAADGLLDAEAGYPLAKTEALAASGDEETKKLVGYDRLGILTPWGVAIMKRLGNEADLSTRVGDAGTIQDHILHFAVDLDGDGIIDGANVGGESVDIRATAAVWCCGKDGKLEAYSKGLKKDDVYSWSKGQTQKVK